MHSIRWPSVYVYLPVWCCFRVVRTCGQQFGYRTPTVLLQVSCSPLVVSEVSAVDSYCFPLCPFVEYLGIPESQKSAKETAVITWPKWCVLWVHYICGLGPHPHFHTYCPVTWKHHHHLRPWSHDFELPIKDDQNFLSWVLYIGIHISIIPLFDNGTEYVLI